eukprot:TRINITY_DN293_c0_g1_i2.p3 TRINITY_DN293_c0_g1~~TRINITY_DN293_c0_g1_i2.p3  ORF type:complete len:225 (-),score=48.22 TRINITY_DN293_c0_g1_i2:137-811(-)
MAVKPLWQPELQMVLPKAVVSPSPLITTLVPVGHDAAALRRPAESALPPPPVADQTRQQRQEQELVELLSSQGDTEQLPVPPAVDVFPQAPLRVVRPPLWSNPRPSYDAHPLPTVALGLPTMSTTTSGGSAHKNHEHKPASNPASGVLGVASFLTAPGTGGGCSNGTSSRRVYTDDSCAVDSMRQHSSSAHRRSSVGSRPMATVSSPVAPPSAPAPFCHAPRPV